MTTSRAGPRPWGALERATLPRGRGSIAMSAPHPEAYVVSAVCLFVMGRLDVVVSVLRVISVRVSVPPVVSMVNHVMRMVDHARRRADRIGIHATSGGVPNTRRKSTWVSLAEAAGAKPKAASAAARLPTRLRALRVMSSSSMVSVPGWNRGGPSVPRRPRLRCTPHRDNGADARKVDSRRVRTQTGCRRERWVPAVFPV